jgi:hypothetical protein
MMRAMHSQTLQSFLEWNFSGRHDDSIMKTLMCTLAAVMSVALGSAVFAAG